MIELFREIDQRWGVPFTPKPILHLIGAGALIIQEPRHQRATKDGDIYEALPLEQPVQDRLLELAGRNSEIHVRLRLYVEILHNGFPFLPQLPVWHPIRSFAHFDLVALDIVDICVSKLIRFSADDREDIDAMVQLGLVAHATFLARFRSAAEILSMDARAAELPDVIANLHQVETDMIGADPTEIELPSWI